MFNTRNKSGISAHPCIILYLFQSILCLEFVNLSFIFTKTLIIFVISIDIMFRICESVIYIYENIDIHLPLVKEILITLHIKLYNPVYNLTCLHKS